MEGTLSRAHWRRGMSCVRSFSGSGEQLDLICNRGQEIRSGHAVRTFVAEIDEVLLHFASGSMLHTSANVNDKNLFEQRVYAFSGLIEGNKSSAIVDIRQGPERPRKVEGGGTV